MPKTFWREFGIVCALFVACLAVGAVFLVMVNLYRATP